PGGFLFLGVSEMASTELFEPLSKPHRIYRARRTQRDVKPPLPELFESAPLLQQRLQRSKRPSEAGDVAERHMLALEQRAPRAFSSTNAGTLCIFRGPPDALCSPAAGRRRWPSR